MPLSLSNVDRLLDEVAVREGLPIERLRSLLSLRRRHLRDGNRRRLFSALDDGLDALTGPPVAGSEAARFDEGPVRLGRLTFRNWKVFQALDLELPEFSPTHPVILIGGKNGYGKTSLLEGLLYGLFGREAVLDLARPEAAARQSAYRQMLERAFNRGARGAGDTSMWIRSEWSTPDGPFRVERKWFFDTEGQLLPDDETLTVWSGEDGAMLPCPTDSDPTEFYQAEIHRRLLSPALAAFVFFDGEQVQKFAQTALTQQVRIGVESALGLAAWRGLAADLRDYLRERGRGAPRSDTLAQEAQHQRTSELQRLNQELAQLQKRKEPPERRRDELLAEIAGLEAGTYADLHALLERRQALVGEQARARHELAAAATQVVPERLTADLRAVVARRLKESLIGAAPDSGLFADERALEALLAATRQHMPPGQGLPEDLVGAMRAGWKSLQAPAEMADADPFPFLSTGVRMQLERRLSAVADTGPLAVAAATQQTLADEALEIEARTTARRTRDERLGAARRELHTVRQDLAALEGELRVLDARRSVLQAEVDARAAARAAASLSASADGVEAQAMVDAIETLLARVMPICFSALGVIVTQTYRALAHKDVVSRIEISEDGVVSLLDARGQDVRDVDASAGESQVFAMALMAAVSAIGGERLPVIIDTPLGRLDPDHRQRILEFFTTRTRQTILLSQPDEVSGRYLDLIANRIAARFRLDHASPDGGPGGSVMTPGYFPELAA